MKRAWAQRLKDVLEQAAEPGVVDALGGGRELVAGRDFGIGEDGVEQGLEVGVGDAATMAWSSANISSGSRWEAGRKSARSTSESGMRWRLWMVSCRRFWKSCTSPLTLTKSSRSKASSTPATLSHILASMIAGAVLQDEREIGLAGASSGARPWSEPERRPGRFWPGVRSLHMGLFIAWATCWRTCGCP